MNIVDSAYIAAKNSMILASGGGLSPDKVIQDADSAMQSGGSFSQFGEKASDVGGGAYNLVYRVGILVGLITLLVVGIRFMVSNARTRDEAKSQFLWTVGGVIVVVSAVGFVLFIANAATGLFSSTGTP